ncbi:MAG TPA: porin [Steroidobacteraceae bacterium]|nr:porin [Steroidobacteraceae bacterium]
MKRTLASFITLLLTGSGALAADAKLDHDGLTLRLADKAVELNVGGRLHMDSARYDSDLDGKSSGSGLRRARVGLSADIADRLRLRGEYEFASQGRGWKSLWAAFRFNDRLQLRAGQQTAPFSMESIASSNNISLMERSLLGSLAPNLLTGADLEWQGRSSTFSVGYFGNSLSQDPGDNLDSGRSLVGRLTHHGGRSRSRWHVGLATEFRQLNGGATSRVRSTAGFALDSPTVLSTGRLAGIDNYIAVGGELGLQAGAWNLQGQFMRRANRAPTLGNPQYDAAYVQVAWAITGESRGYSERQGVFTDIRPRHDFGALELVARVSQLDLNNATVTGGFQRDVALGVNWMIGRNARLMADHVWSRATPNRNGVDEKVNAWGLRAQVDF